MFLIQISKTGFIDGEKINWLNIDHNSKVIFTIDGDGDMESSYEVSTEYVDVFLNNLQAIDKNDQPLKMLRNHIKRN